MNEALEILTGAWTEAPYAYEGKYFQVSFPELRPRTFQRPHPPIWRSVISPASFSECGRLGVPILTARLPLARIAERWDLYRAGLEAGGHDESTQQRLLDQAALWRNVYIAASDAQAEDELTGFLTETREHMTHVRAAHNPADFVVDPAMLNP